MNHSWRMSLKMHETDREFIAQNPDQGQFKRVLCVCSGGILRSATAAVVFAAEPYNFNTRACGTKPYALIQVDHHLIGWADEILCMESFHEDYLRKTWQRSNHYPKDEIPLIRVLDIPDTYDYRDPALIARIKRSYEKETKE